MRILIIYIALQSIETLNAEELPLCSTTSNLTKRQLCKISPEYPLFPIQIQPHLVVLEVLDLDEKSNAMTISIQMKLSWNDTMISVEGPKSKQSEWLKVDLDSDLYWPRLKYEYQRKSQRLQLYGEPESYYQYFWYHPPHHFEYIEYLAVTVGCFLKPTSYPFDNHECNFTFYAPDNGNHEIEFLAVDLETESHKSEDRGDVRTILDHGLSFDITVETLKSFVIPFSGKMFSVAGILFKFHRQDIGTLITGYFVPTVLYSLASALAFTISKEQVSTAPKSILHTAQE